MNLDIQKLLEKYEAQIDRFRQNQHRFFIGLTTLIAFYLLFNFLHPAWGHYRQKSKELTAYKQTLEKKRLNLLNKETVEKQLRVLRKTLTEREEEFFTEETFSEFSINTLSEIAKSYDIAIQSIRYKKTVSRGDKMSAYPLTLSMEGPFSGIAKVMYELETFPKFVRITSFTMNQKNISPPVIAVVCEVEAYVAK